MDTVIKKFLLPWKPLIFFTGVIAVVCFIQLMVYAGVGYQFKVKVADVACTVKEFVSDDGEVKANIQCGEHEGRITDADFIAEYLKKPRTFTCTVYEDLVEPKCKMIPS